jgi:hypothetical protein
MDGREIKRQKQRQTREGGTLHQIPEPKESQRCGYTSGQTALCLTGRHSRGGERDEKKRLGRLGFR